MIQCPYCGRDMKKGLIQADGQHAMLWVEADKKRSLSSQMNNSDCILLQQETFFYKASVDADYCDNCDKIVIEVKSKFLPAK
ncbi:MAG: PF20097 family protein [Solirubrobacterales bacterium]